MEECSRVCIEFQILIDLLYYNVMYHATSTHAPPTALILLSAVLLKNLALTTTGWLGNLPFPRTYFCIVNDKIL